MVDAGDDAANVKIVFCKGQLPGADEILLGYALAMHDAGHDVTVIAVYPHTTRDDVSERLARAGIPIESFQPPAAASLGSARRIANAALKVAPFLRPMFARKAVESAYNAARHYESRRESYFREHAPDLVYVNSPDPAADILATLARDAGCRVVVHDVVANDLDLPILIEPPAELAPRAGAAFGTIVRRRRTEVIADLLARANAPIEVHAPDDFSIDARSAFLRRIDVYVIPPLLDEPPNSAIAAMAHAIPVIAVGEMANMAVDRALRLRMGDDARKRYEAMHAPRANRDRVVRGFESMRG